MTKLLKLVIGLLPLFWVAPNSWAEDNAFDVSIGVYTITGKNARTGQSASYSGLGAYQLTYRRGLSKNFDIGLGYSVYFSKVISGDTVFGLDLVAQYYPFTSSKSVFSQSNEVSMQLTELWRPFVGVTFMQRNFQGIQTTYVGFAGVLGVQYALAPKLSLITSARYAALNASSVSSATELNFSAGVSFGF